MMGSALPRPYFERGGVTLYHGDCRALLPHRAEPPTEGGK